MDITGFSMPDVNAIGNVYNADMDLFSKCETIFSKLIYKVQECILVWNLKCNVNLSYNREEHDMGATLSVVHESLVGALIQDYFSLK